MSHEAPPLHSFMRAAELMILCCLSKCSWSPQSLREILSPFCHRLWLLSLVADRVCLADACTGNEGLERRLIGSFVDIDAELLALEVTNHLLKQALIHGWCLRCLGGQQVLDDLGPGELLGQGFGGPGLVCHVGFKLELWTYLLQSHDRAFVCRHGMPVRAPSLRNCPMDSV